jgi:malate/lactate dehydrogenase
MKFWQWLLHLKHCDLSSTAVKKLKVMLFGCCCNCNVIFLPAGKGRKTGSSSSEGRVQ